MRIKHYQRGNIPTQVVLLCDCSIVGDTSGKPLSRLSDRDYDKLFRGSDAIAGSGGSLFSCREGKKQFGNQ